MFLARLQLNSSRMALGWAAFPYRVHQRLQMAYEGDLRLLFRIEEGSDGPQILVQSHKEPDWTAAFSDFPVLLRPPEHKAFALRLAHGQVLAFRLWANPTVKREGKRLGLLREEEQTAWLGRKGAAGGFQVLAARTSRQGMVYGTANRRGESGPLRFYGVQFDGLLRVTDPRQLAETVSRGIGSGKGLGFGLLSLARPV